MDEDIPESIERADAGADRTTGPDHDADCGFDADLDRTHDERAASASAMDDARGDEPGFSYEVGPSRGDDDFNAAVEEVCQMLLPVTQFGKYAIVGWSRFRDQHGPGVAVLTSLIDRLPEAINLLKRQGRSFMLGHCLPESARHRLIDSSGAVASHDLPRVLPWLDSRPWANQAVSQALSRFGARSWKARGIGLIDICGFTRVSPTRQLAYLMSLNKAMNTSYAYLTGHCDAIIDVRRSTTGDGYYLWNSWIGWEGDVALLAFLIQTMTVLRQRRDEAREEPFQVRAAFTVGEVFEIADRGVDYQYVRNEVAVGPATSYLARLLNDAVPNQLLLGDFQRQGPRTDPVVRGPADLLDGAVRRLRLGHGAYAVSDRTRAALVPNQRLRVVDKHGMSHYCFNVSGAVDNLVGGERHEALVGVRVDDAPALRELRFLD